MVSNASEDFPDPDTPLTTVSFPCGMSQEIFFRLCVRAPRMMIASLDAFRAMASLDFVRPELVRFDELKRKTPE